MSDSPATSADAPSEDPGQLVEEGKRLSESMLWRLQREYYDRRGPGAWSTGTVPSYVTSNPYIAQTYAHVVMAFLRDAMRPRKNGEPPTAAIDPAHPIYVVELAAGSGRFSWLLLKKLLALKNASSLRGLDLRYVMTDFTATNLDAWSRHRLLQPYLASGALELGRFDVERDAEIALPKSGARLSAATVKNPLVVIANYAFDTFTTDLFRVADGRLEELRLALRAPGAEPPDLSEPEVMAKLQLGWAGHLVEPDGYYGDPILDRILAGYRDRLADTTLAINVGAFRGLRHLLDISGRRLLLLSSDKGHTHEDELSYVHHPHIQFHGSLSMLVNYHALGAYFAALGGVYLPTSQRPLGLKTVACLLGGDADRFADTLLEFRERADIFGPSDFYTLIASSRRDCAAISLEHFLGLLRMSHFDPSVVHEFGKEVLDKVQAAGDALKLELRVALEHVWENFFPMNRDLPFELGRFFLAMRRPLEAVRFNQHSIDLFGEHPVTYSNMGIGHYYAEDPDAAVACFDKALALDPSYALPKAWRTRVLAEKERGLAPAPPPAPAPQRQMRYETPLASPPTASSMKR
jgi:hypothetical protein